MTKETMKYIQEYSVSSSSKDAFDVCDVPEHIRSGIENYLNHGLPPGGFLKALITNDLKSACASADFSCGLYLTHIVRWFHNNAPYLCWGSENAYIKWMEAKQCGANK